MEEILTKWSCLTYNRTLVSRTMNVVTKKIKKTGLAFIFWVPGGIKPCSLLVVYWQLFSELRHWRLWSLE